MIPENINILIADDDKADCLLFNDALEELPVSAMLTIVHNGDQLIEEITKKGSNFPQKNNPFSIQEKFMITGDSIIIPDKK